VLKSSSFSILKNCTVANPVKPGDLYNSLDAKLPDSGEKSIDTLIGKVRDEISPRMVHWSHPENTAWYPAVAPKIIALGSMLENTLSCVGFSWSSSPGTAFRRIIFYRLDLKSRNKLSPS